MSRCSAGFEMLDGGAPDATCHRLYMFISTRVVPTTSVVFCVVLYDHLYLHDKHRTR